MFKNSYENSNLWLKFKRYISLLTQRNIFIGIVNIKLKNFQGFKNAIRTDFILSKL